MSANIFSSEISFLGVDRLTMIWNTAAPASEGKIGLPQNFENGVNTSIVNEMTEPLINAATAPCQVALFQNLPNMTVTHMPDMRVEIILEI